MSGYRSTLGAFYRRGVDTNFWSASEGGSDAWRRNFNVSHDHINRNKNDKKNGFSVRCIELENTKLTIVNKRNFYGFV